MLRRSLIIAAILALATGCTTIKGIFGDKASKALEPAELVEIESPLAIKASWTRKLGDGNAALGLRHRFNNIAAQVFPARQIHTGIADVRTDIWVNRRNGHIASLHPDIDNRPKHFIGGFDRFHICFSIVLFGD